MFDHMWVNFIWTVLLWLLVLFSGIIIAAMRKGISTLKSKPKRLKSIITSTNPHETLKTIICFAQQSNYKVSALDETKYQLVLDESTTLTSWGFFYPIFISQHADNATLIEVGIKSKFVQIGPIVSRCHEKCVVGIQAALFANAERKSSGFAGEAVKV